MNILKTLQFLHFIGNFLIFYNLLDVIYFRTAPADADLLGVLGLVLVLILAIGTTILTFSYAKKVYST